MINIRLLNTIRAVSIFEATKGLLVLLAGFGSLALIHHNIQQFAEQLVSHLHLNAAKHYPHIFIDTAAHLTDARMWMLSLFAAVYALVRFIEAYGLWCGKRWAEWFATTSGGIYIPFEVYNLYGGFSFLALSAFLANILIVSLMVKALLRSRM